MLEQVLVKLKNKRIVVLGAGLTGMSCVRFLAKHQLSCIVNDSRVNPINSAEFSQQFPANKLVLGQWDESIISQAEVIFASPGIDLDEENISALISPQCVLLGDVELFCQLTDKPMIAVTGSNGKSTVVSLLAHVGQGLGLNVSLGGNIGEPVLDQLADEVDCYVLELSSFQLETLTSMSAVAATVLNVSDDHLDRHKSIANYSAIKQKVYAQCHVAVINRDDLLSFSTLGDSVQEKSASESPALANKHIISFGSDQALPGNFGLLSQGEQLFLSFGQEPLVKVHELPLAGMHNALNYLAVLALGYAAGWSIAEMLKQFSSFSGLPHRCQRIETKDNIHWINDSKATNVGAALAAINGLAPTLSRENKLILVAGGDGKGADFSPLQEVLSKHVGYVFTIGKDGHLISALCQHSKQVADLPTAVKQANELAKSGDIVLLSPACASLDMFTNFAERGQVFTDAVLALQEAS